MRKYVILAVKIIFVVGCLPLIGTFIVNELLNLRIGWAYGIFLVLSVLLAIDIVGHTLSYSNVWGNVKGTTRKFIIIVTLIIFLTIVTFPAAQEIQNRWVKFSCVLIALINFIPLLLFEKMAKNCKKENA